MEHLRKCVGCGCLKNRDDMIKITYDKNLDEIVLNPNSKIFGRSVYLCYNKACIETAFKKNKIGKHLKATIPNELKGQLLDELRNS